MRLTLGAVLATGLLALVGCSKETDGERDASPPGDGQSSTATDQETAGPETGDLLVHGTVLDEGEPVSGAAVAISLFPETEEDVQPGDPVDVWEGEPVLTGEDGRYALAIDPGRLSSRYFNGDYLNYQVSVRSDGRFSVWHSTVWLVRGNQWRSDADALPGDQAMDMSFDLGSEELLLTDSFAGTETEELPVYEPPHGP